MKNIVRGVKKSVRGVRVNNLLELILKDFVATSDNDEEYCTIKEGCEYNHECLTHHLDYYLEKNSDKYNEHICHNSSAFYDLKNKVIMLENRVKNLEEAVENELCSLQHHRNGN